MLLFKYYVIPIEYFIQENILSISEMNQENLLRVIIEVRYIVYKFCARSSTVEQ